jgi:hypothetical protein
VPYLEVGGTVLGIDLIGHSSVLHEKETAWELSADFTRMFRSFPSSLTTAIEKRRADRQIRSA